MHRLDILDNGLRVVTRPMSHMESFSLGVWIRVGGRYEHGKNNGITHLLEHLLFKGTEKRDTRKIKEEIEGRGGTFNGFTSEECTCYLVKLLPREIELGVDILTDMVLNPKLDETEIEKEKSVVSEEINMYKDIPAQYVHEILSEMLWPGQPLGMPLAGTAETVKSLKRKDLVSYKETFYNPQNMIIVGTGKIEEDDLVKYVKKYLAGVEGHKVPVFEEAFSKQVHEHLVVEHRKTEQTHLALGFHAPHRFDPDRYVVSLANIILGANMSSRLFHIVRDEMALCYEISSSVRRYEDAGAFVISAGVDDKKLLKSLEVVLKVISSMKKEPAGAEELRRAKEYYRGQLLFALEDTMSLMLWLGEKIIIGEKETEVKRILERVEAVTVDDIMQASNKIFTAANANLAVIGPIKDAKKVREVLRFS